MTKYHKNAIGLTDQFDPSNYSAVNDEICLINERTGAVPIHFKVEIIISFLKDHSLQINWIDANPELTDLVTSQILFTGSIESLFDCCRTNPIFRKDLENYLRGKLNGSLQH